MKSRWSLAGLLLSVGLLSLAGWVLHRELKQAGVHAILAHLHALPAAAVALALAATALGYLALTGYDKLAFTYIRNPLPYRRVALASFIAYVFGHNIGLSFFGGSAVRFRLLSTWGVKPGEITRVIGFNMITFWLGYCGLGALALTLAPPPLPAGWPLGPAGLRALGLLMGALVAAYLAFAALRRRPLTVRGVTLEPPSPRLALGQLLVSLLDWSCVVAVLYVLLPAGSGIGYPHLLGAFLLAQIAALISNVPAGLGVFEAAMVLLLAPWLPAEAVLGSILAYRIIYYLLPLAVGIALFVTVEILQRQRQAAWLQVVARRWLTAIAPRLFAFSTVVAGVILLASGATPSVPGRLHLLERLLPLHVIEASHFLGSLIGVGLLLLARALQLRLDAGYWLSLGLLALGVTVSLAKGFDYEEALVLAAMFAALLPCRRYFDRRSSLLTQGFTPGWILGISLALAGTAFLVLLSYRQTAWSQDLWWRVELSADVSRSLRAAAGATLAAVIYGSLRLLRPVSPPAPLPGEAELARAALIAAGSPRSEAHLALVGDKQLLFHPTEPAFLMFGVQGRSWISMSDPVGPPEARAELAWTFRERADRHGGHAVFYKVSAEDMPLYIDLGLSLHKLGEEALVPLEHFNLEGAGRKGMRQILHRMERDGVDFEIVPAEGVPALLDELEEVSRSWLTEKETREKGFSLGYFERGYLARLPVALARREGRVLAFANLWPSGERAEISIDLMRHTLLAPPSVMEFLFIRLMLWGQEQGYRSFCLGMAPMSGLEPRRLSPLWNRAGALLYLHGEQFYNFQGLRAFKEKFDPVWEPRYLASPGGLRLPVALAQVASLIAGGWKGIVTK